MIKTISWQTLYYRLLIVLFFIIVFAVALYFPKISDLFFAQQNIIHVYTFNDMITEDAVAEFKKKTGITAKLKYFDANDELLAQFKINKGEGYDLIIASDFAIDTLIKDQCLQKIDTSRLQNFKYIDKRFLDHLFDRGNQYSVPLVWSTYGILYKKELFDPVLRKRKMEMNWDFVFKDPKTFVPGLDYKICMINTPRDVVFLTAIGVCGRIHPITEDDVQNIKSALTLQKNWVEVYMFGGVQYYLLGDVVPMAVCDSAAAMNMYNVSDAFRYVIPPKGSILGIENLSIPVLSEKSEMAHQFIDFLISKEICLYNSLEYGYNPANKESYEGIDKKFTSDVSFFPDDETFKRLSPNLISDEISQEQLEDIWNSVRLT